jgi:integrase/recombinase XerD
MTHLRKIMLEELERRNYAQATIDCYLRAVAEFSLHFHRPPNQLGPEHIRQYQAHLFGQRKLAPSTVTQRLAALRFFYIKTLRKPWSIADTPYPKKVQRLPIILSSEEVAQLIDSALTPFHHILLMALYATGVRRAGLFRNNLRPRVADSIHRYLCDLRFDLLDSAEIQHLLSLSNATSV